MDWYRIECDEAGFRRDVRPPGSEPWTADIAWRQVIRVCFEVGGMLDPATFHVFTEGREASYRIPSEAEGASAFVGALHEHERFPAELYFEAIRQDDGSVTCYPPMEE